jgi:hypothetical protein
MRFVKVSWTFLVYNVSFVVEARKYLHVLLTSLFHLSCFRFYFRFWKSYVKENCMLLDHLGFCLQRMSFKLLSKIIWLWSEVQSREDCKRMNCMAFMIYHKAKRIQKVVSSWGQLCKDGNISFLNFSTTAAAFSGSVGESVYKQSISCNDHAVVTLSDLEIVLSSHFHMLSSCFHKLQGHLASQILLLSNLKSSLDEARTTVFHLQLQIKSAETDHSEKKSEYSARVANLTEENTNLKDSILRAENAASFANESQKGAWIALQQISGSFQILQAKYSSSLEQLSLFQQENSKCIADEYTTESAVSLLENKFGALEALLFQALKCAETESGYLVSRSKSEIDILQYENSKLLKKYEESLAAFLISDAQHVLANNEVRRMRHELSQAEQLHVEIKSLFETEELKKINSLARDIYVAQYLDQLENYTGYQCEQLDRLMLSTRIAFNHDYQMIKATAMDAVKVGRAIYFELKAANEEQLLLKEELSVCQEHLIKAAKATALIRRKTVRVGGGYDYVGKEFLDLYQYAASCWWGNAAGIDSRNMCDETVNSSRKQIQDTRIALPDHNSCTGTRPALYSATFHTFALPGLGVSKSTKKVVNTTTQHSEDSDALGMPLVECDVRDTMLKNFPVTLQQKQNSPPSEQPWKCKSPSSSRTANCAEISSLLDTIEFRLRGLISLDH